MTTKTDILKEVIQKKSKSQTLMVLDSMIDNLDEFLAVEITQPAVITELHELLVEHLEVNPRAMQLKHRVPARQRRALLFLRAMRSAVDRVED